MINPLMPIAQEIQAAQLENSLLQDSLTDAIEEFNMLIIQPWELPEDP